MDIALVHIALLQLCKKTRQKKDNSDKFIYDKKKTPIFCFGVIFRETVKDSYIWPVFQDRHVLFCHR